MNKQIDFALKCMVYFVWKFYSNISKGAQKPNRKLTNIPYPHLPKKKKKEVESSGQPAYF